MSRLFTVDDFKVVVTGASRGIGYSIAKLFAAQGAKVVLVGRNKKSLASAIDSMGVSAETPIALELDICNYNAVRAAVGDLEKSLGGIDVLINNAGINIRKKCTEYTDNDWNRIIETNLGAVFNFCNSVAPVMQQNQFGRILNISSIQGVTAWNGTGDFSLAPYCASKAGLLGITKSFALDLAQHNITVNTICPGFIDTPLIRPLMDVEKYGEDILSKTPVGRLGSPDEVASAALFLASRESGYITGHTLMVDGGWTI